MENQSNNQSKEKITKETSDLGLAAFLLMKELKIICLENNNGRGKYKFVFEDTFIENTSRYEILKIDYANSESRRFDGSMRIIKMMIKSKSDERNRGNN